jgi:hypothetical protein
MTSLKQLLWALLLGSSESYRVCVLHQLGSHSLFLSAFVSIDTVKSHTTYNGINNRNKQNVCGPFSPIFSGDSATELRPAMFLNATPSMVQVDSE